MTGKCTKCKEVKPIDNFGLRKDRIRSHTSWCNKCLAKAKRDRYKNDSKFRVNMLEYQRRPEAKIIGRRSKLKRNYGLTIEDVEKILILQDYKCALCNEPFSIEYPHTIDHDHKTGKVRALIHSKCNLLLGHADDNIHMLILAIEYLKKTGAM